MTDDKQISTVDGPPASASRSVQSLRRPVPLLDAGGGGVVNRTQTDTLTPEEVEDIQGLLYAIGSSGDQPLRFVAAEREKARRLVVALDDASA